MTKIERVLIVDHDASFRIAVRDALEADGFTVRTEDRGEPVIAAVEGATFDAIVLNRELPDIGGLELLNFLRHRCPRTSIVLTTTCGGDLSEAVALGSGAIAYLEKPMSPAHLIATLREISQHRRPPRARRAISPVVQIGPEPAPGGEGNLWAVVPARGLGSRLRSLPWRVGGADGAPSLLRRAVNHASLRVPPARIVVPTMRRHRRSIAGELGTPPVRILFQPGDRGTAADVLVPAYWIYWRDPAATVIVLPPDQPVSDSGWLMEHVADAVEFVERYPRWMVMVGTDVDVGPSRHGCIVPGQVLDCAARGPVWRVERYLTAPWMELARRCRTAGGLASTGIVVAQAVTLVDAVRQLLPALHRRFVLLAPLLGTRLETAVLRRAYAIIPTVNFSRAVLEASTSIIAVLRLGERWPDGDGQPGAAAAQEPERVAIPE